MQQKSCAPLTSHFHSHVTPPRSRLMKELVQSPTEGEREWVCDVWRGVLLIHQCAASLWQSAAMLLIDTCAYAHWARCSKSQNQFRCVLLQKLTRSQSYSTHFHRACFLFLFFLETVYVWVWCRAEQWYCSAAQPHTTTSLWTLTHSQFVQGSFNLSAALQWSQETDKRALNLLCTHVIRSCFFFSASPNFSTQARRKEERDYKHIISGGGYYE